MNVTVKVKSDNFSMAKQVNFALAVGLTKTARDGQAGSLKALGATFTLRGNWFDQGNKFGIKITPATKAKLESSVGTDADWLLPSETTGIKQIAGKRILQAVIGGARPAFASKLVRRLKPKAMGKKAFVLKTKAGPMLFYRKGRGKRKNLQALFFMDRAVKVKQKSVLFDPVRVAVETKLQSNFDSALVEALRTARR